MLKIINLDSFNNNANAKKFKTSVNRTKFIKSQFPRNLVFAYTS